MTAAPARATIGAVVLIVTLAAAVVWLQVYRDARFHLAEPAQQVLYVRSPAMMQRLGLSFDAVLADLYWIRAIQYYGGTRLSDTAEKHYELLYPLLELATSLDPQFNVAYRFGAFFLSEPAPGGANHPELAIQLLERGIAANPTRWEYPYDAGFVFYRQADYRQAAEWFRRAADVAGAPPWLRPLAAVTLATGGDTQSSRRLWQNMLATADEDWLRRSAEHRLQQLDAIDTIQQLEAVTAEYRRRHGGPPPSWEALIRDGGLRHVPIDISGRPFVLDPDDGSVTISSDSSLWPLPTERAP
jgi:tetratricopeptide (TPR) repeat protein